MENQVSIPVYSRMHWRELQLLHSTYGDSDRTQKIAASSARDLYQKKRGKSCVLGARVSLKIDAK